MEHRLSPLIWTIAEARQRCAAQFEGHACKVEDLGQKLVGEFGAGFALVWSVPCKAWMAVRQFPWNTDPLYMFDREPVSYKCIPVIREVLALDGKPEKRDMLVRIGQKAALERHEAKTLDLRNKMVEELKSINRLRGSMSVRWPRGLRTGG